MTSMTCTGAKESNIHQPSGNSQVWICDLHHCNCLFMQWFIPACLSEVSCTWNQTYKETKCHSRHRPGTKRLLRKNGFFLLFNLINQQHICTEGIIYTVRKNIPSAPCRPAACHCSALQTLRRRWRPSGVGQDEASLDTSPPPCQACWGLRRGEEEEKHIGMTRKRQNIWNPWRCSVNSLALSRGVLVLNTDSGLWALRSGSRKATGMAPTKVARLSPRAGRCLKKRDIYICETPGLVINLIITTWVPLR